MILEYPIHEYQSEQEAFEKINDEVNKLLHYGWKIIKPVKKIPDHWVEDSYHDEYVSRVYEYFVGEHFTAELKAPLKREIGLPKNKLALVLMPT